MSKPSLETLPDDILLLLMESFDIDTLLSLIAAIPVAYRLFLDKRAYICNVHLGHKYIQYNVPPPLINALHLVHGLKLRDPEHWYRQPEFPWKTNRSAENISLIERQKKYEDFPGWDDIVATCYVKNADENTRSDQNVDSSASEAKVFHADLPLSSHQLLTSEQTLSEANDVSPATEMEHAIAQLLSTKTLAWMKIGIKLIDDMEVVAERFGLNLGPVPRKSNEPVHRGLEPNEPVHQELGFGEPNHFPCNVYPLPDYTPISHLQIWVHEFQCHMRRSVRSHLVFSFIHSPQEHMAHRELAVRPCRALEEAGEPLRRDRHAMLPMPPPGTREHELLDLALAHPSDSRTYDQSLFTSGFEVLARLCRLGSSELEDWHLREFNKFVKDPKSPSFNGIGDEED